MASAPREIYGDLVLTAFVSSSHLFKSLDDDARADLVRLGQAVSWEPGETISPEADDGFYLLVDGTAAALHGDGAESALLQRGAFFGEGRVLAGGRPSSLVARSDVTAVVFPGPVLSVLCERFPKVKKLLEAVHAARERGPTQPA